MTELLLIVALGALGIGFSLVMARGLARRKLDAADITWVEGLVSGGIQRYLRRHNIVAVAVAAAVGAAVFLLYGVAYQLEAVTAVSPREFGVWLAVSYVLGVGLTVAAGWAAAWSSRRASVQVVAGARRSLDAALQIGIRGSAAAGIGGSALALLAFTALLAAGYWIGGGWDADAGHRAQALVGVPARLSGFVLGASVVAVLARLGGGIFGKVADIGADVGGKLEASLPEDSPDNPATIADLVGDAVGDHAGRAASAFATVSTGLLGSTLLAAALFRDNQAVPDATAVVLYPLVIQSFGLLAACFGTIVVRTDDREVPMNALTRGMLVTTGLYSVAAVGAAKWLLDDNWLAFSGCAVAGAAASVASMLAVQYYTDAKYRPVRSVADAARSGASLATLRGLCAALEGAAVLLVVVLASSAGAFLLGASTGLRGGGLFGLSVAGLGLLGSTPFVLAMAGLGSIVDSAGGIVAMTVGAERPDVRARTRVLDAVGNTCKGLSGSLLAAAAAVGSALLLAVFLAEVWAGQGNTARAGTLDLSNLALYVGAALGLFVVLVFSAATLARTTQAARDYVLELRDHLVSEPASGGRSGPADADGGSDGGSDEEGGEPTADDEVPGGRGGAAGQDAHGARHLAQLACVETVSRMALRGMLPPALVGVGTPLLIGAALRIWATGDRVVASAEALVALLLVATIAGALGSLLFSNAGSAWDNAKKYVETGAHGGRYVQDARGAGWRASHPRPPGGRPSGPPDDRRVDNPTYVAAVIGDTIGDPLKGVLGPATQALVQTLAVLALVFLPFFL